MHLQNENNNPMEEEKFPAENTQLTKPILGNEIEEEKYPADNNPSDHLNLENNIEESKESTQQYQSEQWIIDHANGKKFIPMDTFKCPLTQEIFIDPVIASDGHTYERATIQKLQKQTNKSPMTRERFSSNALVPNVLLKTIMLEDPVLHTLMKQTKRYFIVENDQKIFVQAIVDFVAEMKTTLKKTSVPNAIGHKWDKDAAATFVATVIRAARHPESAQQLVENPEEQAVPKELMTFIVDYVNAHPSLKKAGRYPDLTCVISRLLYDGKIDQVKLQCVGVQSVTEPLDNGHQENQTEEKYMISDDNKPLEKDITDIASLPPHPVNIENFIGPISFDTLNNPVTTADGHTYEEEDIVSWLKDNNTSPKTNDSLPHKRLVHNHIIASMIKNKNLAPQTLAKKQRFFVEQSIEQTFARAVVKFVKDMQLYLNSCSVPENYGAHTWDGNAALTFVATTIKRLRNANTYQRLLTHPEESSVPEKVIHFINTYVKNNTVLLKAQTSPVIGKVAYDINVALLKGQLNDVREIYAGLPRNDESNDQCCIL